MPEKNKFIIWPIYFDSARSRSEGRAVAAGDAVESPSIDDIIAAAQKAGLKPEIERDKRHPKTWYESAGRILIPKSSPKSALLKKIAGSLKVKRRKG